MSKLCPYRAVMSTRTNSHIYVKTTSGMGAVTKHFQRGFYARTSNPASAPAKTAWTPPKFNFLYPPLKVCHLHTWEEETIICILLVQNFTRDTLPRKNQIFAQIHKSAKGLLLQYSGAALLCQGRIRFLLRYTKVLKACYCSIVVLH